MNQHLTAIGLEKRDRLVVEASILKATAGQHDGACPHLLAAQPDRVRHRRVKPRREYLARLVTTQLVRELADRRP
jgi:hypothetical protein